MLLIRFRLPAAPSGGTLLLSLLAVPGLTGGLLLASPLEELFGEHVLSMLETDKGAGVFPSVWAEARRKTRDVLSHLYRQAGLA